MTIVVDDTQGAAPPEAAPDAVVVRRSPIAAWPARAGAFGIDVLLGIGALASVVLVAGSADRGTWLWWACVWPAAIVLLAVAVNRLLLPALTGWSVGRALFGIAVVERDGARVGPWRLLTRDAAHLLDTAALFIGWLRPLWDTRGRTFADLVARTEVHRNGPVPAGARRRVAVVASSAALVAVAAVAVGYAGVYRPELRVAQTRELVAVEGPRIVEQMLSYDPATLSEDFGRAQSLVTDTYRPQLVEQQQAVRTAGPVANAYWVTNSSVLSATAHTATMLLLMQGQRGAPPNQRGISATVTVDFDRVGSDWRVNSLTVLAKPKSPTGAR